MYKHIVILFLYLINDGVCLVIYDITSEIISTHENVKVIAYLKTADMFFKRFGSTESCDFNFFYINPSRFCDYEFYFYMGILKPELTGKKSVKDFSGYYERTFDMNSDRKVWKYDGIIKYFNMGSMDMFFRVNNRNLYYFEPDLPIITHITYKYSDIIQMTNVMGDDDSFIYGWYKPFARFTLNVFATRTDVYESILFQRETYIPVTNSMMLEKYIVEAKCVKPYYGKTCWYFCEDNSRIYCNCADNTNKFSICDIQCKPGWMRQYIIYTVDNMEIYMPRCDTMDICVHPPISKCRDSQTCLPVDNYTRFCEYIYPAITKVNSSWNITSDVFLYNDLITIYLDFSLLVQSDVGVNTTTAINNTEFVFQEEILTNIDGFSYPFIIVGGLNFIDKMMNFTIIFNLQAWALFISVVREFRVNVAPGNIKIFHRDNWTNVILYIFIGERLVTNTSGLPEYRSIFFWQSDIFDSIFNFGNEILVPGNSLLGPVYIKCNSTLIMDKRNDASISSEFTYFIKPFQFFDWNKTNNVLDYGITVKCQAKAFIFFQLWVAQLKGQSNLNILNDYVLLKDIDGGYYEIICHFITNYGYFFTTYLRFKLRNNSTTICLFLYTNTLGSVIQCGHDGNIPDEYTIQVKLFLYTVDSTSTSYDKLNYIRLPFRSEYKRFSLICNITNKINNFKIGLTVYNTLVETAHGTYYISQGNKLCLKNAEFIEEPLIQTQWKGAVKLYHYIFYLQDKTEMTIAKTIIFIIFMIYPVITFISIMVYGFSNYNQTKLIEKTNVHSNKLLKKRKMTDQLKMQARQSLIKVCHDMDKYFSNPE